MNPTPDLFAGPGGWDIAARRLGIATRGFEADNAACLTRKANGLDTVEGDLTTLDPTDHAGPGQIASPPCQGFSTAGKGKARAQSERLIAALDGITTAEEVDALIADVKTWAEHEGLWLVLEPLRWALHNRPRWIAWEQVPAVLVLWEAIAVILIANGYTVATGNLSSETFGVPQTRKRAILVARDARTSEILGPVKLPPPTHSTYNTRTPEKIEPGMPRWVSMAEVLPWGDDDVVGFPRKADSDNVVTIDGEDYRARDFRSADRPSVALTEKARSSWRLRQLATGTRPNSTRRTVWTPDGMTPAEVVAHKVNNQSGTEYDVEAQVATPATSVAGREIVGFRGPNANRFNGSTKSRNDGIRLTPEEAACLQTFPVGYVFEGSKTQTFQQIGDAIPPLMAEAILCAVIGLPFDPSPQGLLRRAPK